MTKYINDKLKSPNFFLFFAIVCSAIVLMLVGTHVYDVMEDVLDNSEHSQKIRSRVENIRHLDEVLTSSTLLAASTGDAQWEKRYRLFKPKLDNAFNELLRIDPLHAIPQRLQMTDSANVHLNAMEHRVFELEHLGKHDEASAIIMGSDYARLKAIYSEGLSLFIKQHEQETDQLQMQLSNAAIHSKWSFGLVILLLAIVWLPIVRYFRKSRAQMLQQNQELELQIQARKESESALFESKKQIEKAQEQLRESIQASSIGLWEWNIQTNETYQSPEFKKQIGYEDDEVESNSEFYFSHLHPEDAIIVNELTPKLLDGSVDPLELEYRFRHKNGSYIWMLARTTLQRDQYGKPWRLFGSHIDISERKRAEEALQESEEKFRLIIENIGEAILFTEPNGAINFANPEACRIFGFSNEEFQIGGRSRVVNLGDPRLPLALEERKRTGKFKGELTCVRKDGSIFPAEIMTNIFIDSKGKEKTSIIINDITERKKSEEKIKESEENYRILAESSPEMIYLIDTKGYVTYLNKVAAAQFRAPAQELVGKHLNDIFPPDLAQQNLAGIRNVIATKRNFQNEVEMAFPTGSRWIDARLTPVFDEKGDVTGVLGLSYDITERKKSEEKLNLLAHAVKNSGDSIIITNKDHHIIFVNDSFCNVHGYKEVEIVGQPIAVILSENNLPEIGIDLFSAVAKKKIWTGDILSKRKNGSDIQGQLSLSPLLTDTGEIIAFVAIVRDITERKHIEMELRESVSRTKAMYQAVPDMLFRLNRQGIFLDYKAESKDLYTQSNQNIIGSHIRDIFPSDFADLIDRQICVSLDTKTLQTFEYKLPMPGLGVRDYEARMIVSGAVEVTTMVRDITDRKLVEEEIKLKNEELQNLNIEKDKFFSIIAHDLRGPLGGIMGLTDMIADESDQFTPDQKKNMSLTLSHSARNIFNLLENLLEWSQMQKGNIEFDPQLHVLKEVVYHGMKTLAELARKKHIEIVVNISDEQKLFVDTNMLQTIIRNLASNAIKFTPQRGIVTITGKVVEENIAIFSVKDTGIGMSKEMLDNLFRLDVNTGRKGTDGEPSTGLGLLLCKEFIEKHGGSLWVESEEGKGSVFYFTLPFVKVAKENIIVEDVVSTDRAADQIKKLKILVAEDDETSYMLFTISLSNISRDLLHAKTGVEAIDICRNNPDTDLLLMDIEMPEMDGYEATRQIRLFNKDIVIFAQTAFAFTDEKEKSIEAGCNDYISKPIDSTLLLGLIQKHFKKQEN